MANVQQIEDPADPRVDLYRTVRDPKLVREKGVFIAESREVVRRLLLSTRFVTRSVFVTPSAHDALETLLNSSPAEVYRAERAVLEQVTGYEIHRGCIAIGERADDPPLERFFGQRLLLGLEAVTDPDNIGSIFRTAFAFGAGGALLSPRTVEPLYRKAIRTSMGATLDLPYRRLTPWPAALDSLRANGFCIIAVTPDAEVDIVEIAATTSGPTLLLLGNEGDGLSADTCALADVRAQIPMRNRVDSINVGVAAGIAIHLFAGSQKP